jgi:hypothetical protein
MKKQIITVSYDSKKKVYEKADFMIVNLESEDIICSSANQNSNPGNGGENAGNSVTPGSHSQMGSVLENWNNNTPSLLDE